MHAIKTRILLIIIGIIAYIALPAYALSPCDPFTVSCRNQNEILTKYSLSALSMAGTIQDASGHLWAILKTPDNHVYPVSVGSAIGTEGGKVLQITSQELIIQQANTHITLNLRTVN